MTALFLKLLNLSISASWIVLAVVVLRALFKNAPKWVSCLLWVIVALRLVIPFSLESIFSLIPSAEVIPSDIASSQSPAIQSGIPAVNGVINPLLAEHITPGENTMEAVLHLASNVWIAGLGIMLLYSAVTYFNLRRQVRASIPREKNILVCDEVRSPFILGIFRPKIYLPSGMDEAQLRYVLAHENAHIQRRDHWWKPLGFVLLTIYWFNPLLWLAYILLCRDIEQACDEKVIAQMDNAGKKGYSAALIACSIHRRMVMACPVAFGEVGVKDRIKGIANYKKPAFWIILVSVAACVVAAVCFLTDPAPCKHEYISRITMDATCSQEGVETLTCSLCKHYYTEPVARLAHAYDAGTVTAQPNCLHPGSKALACTGCGAVKTETLAKTAHSGGASFITKEPDCIHAGERAAECTVCQTTYVVEVLAANDVHALTETVLQEATCAAPGEGLKTCTRCDHSESCTYEQLAHNYEAVHYVAPTCAAAGSERNVCSTCGDENLVTLPKTYNHQWQMKFVGQISYNCCVICGAADSEIYDWSVLGDPYTYPTYDRTWDGWPVWAAPYLDEDDPFPVIRIWP